MHIIKPGILLILFCHIVRLAYGQGGSPVPIPKDTGKIKVDSLKPVTVTAALRPKMRGDTLEYNTEHIQMAQYSVVEELLRRLPGLHVAADGTITYNGERIDHLLVDGQDIFGSDPTLVTRSFDASKIARVQILDRKSDDAVFTGIDDGGRTKTINLVLKADARNGYFGKVEAGGNTDNYYNANGAMAGFRDHEQLTVLGMSSNTGAIGTSLQGGGDIGFLYGISDPLGASAGTGIPQYTAGALHYGNSWGRPADHAGGNYQYSHYHSQPFTTTQSYQTQADSVYGQYQQSRSDNLQEQHWVDAQYNWAPAEATAFRFKLRVSHTDMQNQFSSIGNSSFNDTLVNSSQRGLRDKMDRQYTGGDLDWRIRISKKTGAAFSITTSYIQIDATTTGYLYDLEQFYQPNGQLQSVDTIDQRKMIVSHHIMTNSSINYVQPLWNGPKLGLSYNLSSDGDRPLQGTYARGEGQYTILVDSLSSNLKTRAFNQRVTISLNGKAGPINYAVSNNWLGFSYKQDDLIADSVLKQHYWNWAPSLQLDFRVGPTNLDFNYSSSTQEPSIGQLAPIKNNTNPLYISIGNPDLKPSLTQNLGLNLRRFKTWGMDLNATISLTSNSFSSKTMTDSLGRQISEAVNVSGGQSGKLNLFIHRNILGVDFGVLATGSFSQSMTYVNTDLSRNDASTVGGGFGISRYVPDRYNLELTTNFAYFNQISSINLSAPVHYWTQSHSASLTMYFIPRFEINTNGVYTWQEKTGAFSAATSVLIWNAAVSRKFLQNRLAVKVQLNNLLNQNSGISRSSSGNTNVQSSTNILGRYWMLSAIYHFDKKFKQK